MDILLVKLQRLNRLTWVHDILGSPLFTQGDRDIIYLLGDVFNRDFEEQINTWGCGFSLAKSIKFIQETSTSSSSPLKSLGKHDV
jgi:hypothetical protein